MPLEEEEQQHLEAAEGFLDLGMFFDADTELDRIDPHCRHLPEVLMVRVRVYAALEKWDLLQVIAKRLADNEPEEPKWLLLWADALRRTDAIASAKALLLEAVERHPSIALLQYRLACCECALGETENAKARLGHALKMDANLRIAALDEPDLKPVWDSFR